MTRNPVMIAAIIALAWTGPAFANGGGGGSGSSGSSNAGGRSVPQASSDRPSHSVASACKPGFLRAANQTCVPLQIGTLSDDELYARGRALALAGDYAGALPLLEAVRRTNDAMVFTMRGYATRKLGRAGEAMTLYARALAIDPVNVNAIEYVGEAYVMTGRIDLARRELANLERSCGSTKCEQYLDLERAIGTSEVE